MINAAQGSRASQAALFVFKNDGSRQSQAWANARNLRDVRCELHIDPPNLVKGLTQWNKGVDPTNAFLAVYAHMGAAGMAPTTTGPILRWADFQAALPYNVHTLWLAGCSSKHALAAWPTPAQSPVRGSLLITSASKDWMPLVSLFEREVSLDDITFFDEMEALVKGLMLTDDVNYLDASDPQEWKPFAPRDRADRIALTEDELANLSTLLWG